MKLLNVGCTPEYQCNDPRKTFGEIELFTMDVDEKNKPDYLWDIRTPVLLSMYDLFDVVYASHVLEHVERAKVHTAVENFKHMLHPGGRVWIFVPSLEWACKKIMRGQDSAAVQGVLYGGQKDQWDMHYTGYTLESLAYLVRAHGMTVHKAGYGAFASTFNGKRELVLQNLVVGVKDA